MEGALWRLRLRSEGRDLRALAAIVSEDRADLPDGEGLPPSLLADLMGQIRCDEICLERYDSGRQAHWCCRQPRSSDDTELQECEDPDRACWERFWACQFCSYPDRTGDLRSVVKPADFYSTRQWHSTGMYTDIFRPQGYEHDLSCACPIRRAERRARADRPAVLLPRARAGFLRA